MSQFSDDTTPITASPGSPFWDSLNCTEELDALDPEDRDGSVCVGSAEDWVLANFGEFFDEDNIPCNILYLVGVIVVARVITYFALIYLNFRST